MARAKSKSDRGNERAEDQPAQLAGERYCVECGALWPDPPLDWGECPSCKKYNLAVEIERRATLKR